MNFVGKRLEGIGFLQEIARGVRSKIFLVSYQEKIFAAKFFMPEFYAFAEREYQFGHRLRHPNINQICQKVEVQDHAGVLMPFIPGKKLNDYYSASPETFLPLFLGLLEGLKYLHEQDIIHRDIKPENVIVVNGVPKLIDFDLAKQASQLDSKKTLVGTIAYFSPEVVQGQEASKTSDLYSAAVILYRALTGEVPFTGTLEEVMHAQEHTKPALPSSFHPELKAYDELLRRALAKNPLERFPSAAAFIGALKAL
ncbi:MAG: serine/threonine protein kinase [Trueperaceae bacterium]|nr:serine/threonine protein kinase [Trueperaceae bacterium]